MTRYVYFVMGKLRPKENPLPKGHGKSQVLLFPMKKPSKSGMGNPKYFYVPMKSPSTTDMGKHHTSKSPFSPLKDKHQKALSHDFRVLPKTGTGKCLL